MTGLALNYVFHVVSHQIVQDNAHLGIPTNWLDRCWRTRALRNKKWFFSGYNQ